MERDIRLNTYLRNLRTQSDAIARLYPETEIESSDSDSLNEHDFEVVPGLVHKFTPSVLWLLNGVCAAQCSFCERLPKGVGDAGQYSDLKVSDKDLTQALKYIQNHPEIQDVIFSGGDPLTQLSGLKPLVEKLVGITHVRTIRIHTKYPLQNPRGINGKRLEDLAEIATLIEESGKMSYFSINTSHPDEFSDEVKILLRKIRKMGYVMISQSVFLKGINGDVETLVEMFSELSAMGITPYYLYHCQSKSHTHQLGFVEDIQEEIKIVRAAFEKLPGIARPKHVIDIEGQQHESGIGRGKVVIPHHFRQSLHFVDYDNRNFSLENYI